MSTENPKESNMKTAGPKEILVQRGSAGKIRHELARKMKLWNRVDGKSVPGSSMPPKIKMNLTPQKLQIVSHLEKIPMGVLKVHMKSQHTQTAQHGTKSVGVQRLPQQSEASLACSNKKQCTNPELLSKDVVMRPEIRVSCFPDSRVKLKLFQDMRDCLSFDEFGNMPIHNAVLNDDPIAVKRCCLVLSARRIHIDIDNTEKLVPLQLAVMNNSRPEIVDTLLRHGSDALVVDGNGNTIYHLAAANSNGGAIDLLLRESSRTALNAKNDDGLTPLMLAVLHDKPPAVELLLEHGADPDERDEKSGRTALFHAFENNRDGIAGVLLKHGANPNIPTFYGVASLDAAKIKAL